ncbi:hypothetical protein F5X98DRAFT_389170 [Xylaria grammica]|nr:hypothetical protein F5X98DRAFT_389170 [Xylaria grammica]
MSDSTPTPLANDGNLGLVIMGLGWSLTSLATIALAGRFYVRIWVTKSLGIDDWLMLISGVLQIAFQILLTVAYTWGLGKPNLHLTIPQTVSLLELLWTLSIPGIVGAVISRISIAILLIRLFGTKTWLKRYLVIITTFIAVIHVVLIVLTLVQSIPVEGLWNPFIPARRLDPQIFQRYGYFTESVLALADLTYALFPVMIIWKLEMRTRRKVGLSIVMGLSLITVAASILKVVTIPTATSGNAALSEIATGTEQAIVIIMGCIPALLPLGKLRHPLMKYINTSLAFLVRTRSSKNEDNLPSTDTGADAHAPYHKLHEMDSNRLGKLHIQQRDGYDTLTSPTIIAHEQRTGESPSESGQIKRIDDYSVTVEHQR